MTLLSVHGCFSVMNRYRILLYLLGRQGVPGTVIPRQCVVFSFATTTMILDLIVLVH